MLICLRNGPVNIIFLFMNIPTNFKENARMEESTVLPIIQIQKRSSFLTLKYRKFKTQTNVNFPLLTENNLRILEGIQGRAEGEGCSQDIGGEQQLSKRQGQKTF